MKFLTIGVLVFVGWASLATWLYVCQIKGLCHENNTIAISAVLPDTATRADSVQNTLIAKSARPDMLLVYFAFDKSSFVSDSGVNEFYDVTTTYMFHNSEAGLLITGHTDAIGSDEYNQALGYRRAQRVRDYFKEKGLAPEKITIDSKGEKDPAENNSTDEGRAKNRRASVSVIIN
ncbi:MAG: OmpA family protein [Bacteroidales bacterium]